MDLEARQGDLIGEANCSRPTASAFTLALQRPMTSSWGKTPFFHGDDEHRERRRRVSSAALDNVAT
jgi:hypothetical protein